MKARIYSAKALVLALSFFCLSVSCAKLETMDRGRLNHPALDFQARTVPGVKGFLTGLDSIENAGPSGACSVCAK